MTTLIKTPFGEFLRVSLLGILDRFGLESAIELNWNRRSVWTGISDRINSMDWRLCQDTNPRGVLER